MFKTYKPKRTVNNPKWGDVLNDIDSHMPAGHIYADADRVTHSHETTHGINSDLRQAFGRSGDTLRKAYIPREKSRSFGSGSKPSGVKPIEVYKHGAGEINGFYCLEDKACIIPEPRVRITDVAKLVPRSLRGGVYDLYLVKQAGSWNDTPLYLCDEWMGYTNGSACGLDLAEKNLWGNQRRSDTIAYMLEFNVYVLTLAYVISLDDSGYNDKQFRFFVNWNFERALSFLRKSKQYPAFKDDAHDDYMSTFAKDGGQIYEFAKTYLKSDDLEDFGVEEFL